MIFRKKGIIVILAIIITFSGGFLIFQYLKNTSLEKIFINKISEIDLLLSSGYFSKADELILIASESAVTPLHYQRLLKRALGMQSSVNLEKVSRIAFEKYPKDELILSAYIYVLLNNGKIIDAASILLNQDKQIVKDSLFIETNIKNKSYNEEANLLYQGIDEKNALIYRKLYKLTNNRKFLLDAVLVNLEAGNIQLADTILEEIVSDNLEYQQLQFFIKYDNGKFDSALEILDLFDCGFSIQEIQLLRIDIQIRQEKYSKAQIAIMKFLDIYPDYSWIPYYNYIWLNSVHTISESTTIIEKGLNIYQNNRELLLIITDYYLENNMDKEAIDILGKYIKNNKSDDELEIISKELEGANNPEYFVNIVRNLVNQNPKNISATRYLAWNIFLNEDIPHLQHFLGQIENEGDDGWIDFFRALISIKNGNYKLAIEEFQSSYELEKQWETLYNLAVVYKYKNNYQEAIVYYQKAENSLVNNKENMVTKSLIRTSLASLLYEVKDYEQAYREVRNALDLDIYNLKANLLLKKLESITF